VHLTSDGDAVVDKNDTWVIFKRDGDDPGKEKIIAFELLGHRQEDFRDTLLMSFDEVSENLFLGLRIRYELNEADVDGEKAYLKYTVHVWDGSNAKGQQAVRKDLANCYQSADVWAQQFYSSSPESRTPLSAAEFAVRSQCFSNSRSNQRWTSDDAGFWSINTDHGVHGNIIINPGWLAPNMAFEIFIQKFDEALFRGPRTVIETDSSGQLMTAMPTLVEGDRVMLRAKNNCCKDYDLKLSCVPLFTGFSGDLGPPRYVVPISLGPSS
jgi:hypothetical protein